MQSGTQLRPDTLDMYGCNMDGFDAPCILRRNTFCKSHGPRSIEWDSGSQRVYQTPRTLESSSTCDWYRDSALAKRWSPRARRSGASFWNDGWGCAEHRQCVYTIAERAKPFKSKTCTSYVFVSKYCAHIGRGEDDRSPESREIYSVGTCERWWASSRHDHSEIPAYSARIGCGNHHLNDHVSKVPSRHTLQRPLSKFSPIFRRSEIVWLFGKTTLAVTYAFRRAYFWCRDGTHVEDLELLWSINNCWNLFFYFGFRVWNHWHPRAAHVNDTKMIVCISSDRPLTQVDRGDLRGKDYRPECGQKGVEKLDYIFRISEHATHWQLASI